MNYDHEYHASSATNLDDLFLRLVIDDDDIYVYLHLNLL